MFHSMTKSVFTGLVFSSLVFVAPSHAHTKKEVQKMHITEICATSPSNLPCANLVSHAYFLNEILISHKTPQSVKKL